MPPINNNAKFVIVNVNIFFFWLGLLLLGLALYLWIDLGLASGFILGSGIIIALIGIITCTVALLGCQGVNNQTSKFGDGSSYSFWTGKKILQIYLTFVSVALACMLGLMSLAFSNVRRFHTTVELLRADPTSYPPLTGIEDILQERFNQFFFLAANTCETALYFWFWDWVDDNCPQSLRREFCQGCYYYSPTQCPADEFQCFQSSLPESENPACPYNACREGILQYCIFRLGPFSYATFSFVLFLSFVFLAALMLVCYHQRDNYEQLTYKSGIRISIGNDGEPVGEKLNC